MSRIVSKGTPKNRALHWVTPSLLKMIWVDQTLAMCNILCNILAPLRPARVVWRWCRSAHVAPVAVTGALSGQELAECEGLGVVFMCVLMLGALWLVGLRVDDSLLLVSHPLGASVSLRGTDTARVQRGERSEKTYRHGEAMSACMLRCQWWCICLRATIDACM